MLYINTDQKEEKAPPHGEFSTPHYSSEAKQRRKYITFNVPLKWLTECPRKITDTWTYNPLGTGADGVTFLWVISRRWFANRMPGIFARQNKMNVIVKDFLLTHIVALRKSGENE